MANAVQRPAEPETFTILSGQSLSAGVNLGGRVPVGIYMPASWTAAGLTFQASYDGTNFFNVQNDSAEIALTVIASIYVAMDATRLRGITHLKVRSGTSGTPVNQAADRSLVLMLARDLSGD